MCGRYTLSASRAAIVEGFRIVVRPEMIRPRFNIAPSQPVAVVVHPERGERHLDYFLWGLIPFWAKDARIGNKLINARCETAAAKPAFRAAMKHRRCLVLADGFYEWGAPDGQKRPYLFRMASGKPFGMAGLWEVWHDPTGAEVHTCAILTTEANEVVRPVHARMPVVVPQGAHERWLDPRQRSPAELSDLLAASPPGEMTCWAVSEMVNSPANDEPACIVPLSRPETSA